MKNIQLTKGYEAIVDDEDYEWLNQWKWTYHNAGYAYRKEWPTNKSIYMHREILKAPNGLFVDHIDGNGLNNQNSNLRLCTPLESSYNRAKTRRNQCGQKGCYWNKKHKRWYVRIQVNKKNKWIGHYATLEEAKVAYEMAANKYHGEFARF